MALKAEVTSQTTERVRITYLDRATANVWNYNRSPDDTTIFCGYYWIRGREEGGPFRSRSAAIRDAYYRFVLHIEPPRALAIRTQKALPAPARAARR